MDDPMPLINYNINLMLKWLGNYAITNLTGNGTVATTYTKHYVPVVTLSTRDNAQIIEQLNLRFKRNINRDKYQSKVLAQAQN